MATKTYEPAWTLGNNPTALESAGIVVPIVKRYVECRRVVDLGCSGGAWLSVFKAHGAERILGIDGVRPPPGGLLIPSDDFRVMDFREPIRLDETFDLAVCLEVGSDLPPNAAPRLVHDLTTLAPVVLFSAAQPGDTWEKHRNRQWPLYWHNLFSDRGYTSLDVIRPEIWQHAQVARWYRKNVFLFASDAWLSGPGAQVAQAHAGRAHDLTILPHPSLRRTLRTLPSLARETGRSKMRRVLEPLGERFRKR